ncbi:flagellar motor protein MotA [Limobrevibacterium gyesilva]|uniref:Flagellar motor protein MotA n=1 Tax=Limobrevibacterium gyesilva TaxID=2991712 RepID=A0AA41YRC7_9PROT|nr:flagellar motor protein MotA [Limobrevibacterium gyesilva]MCW3477435.1 flagellar motor protein MotA [Limobrevibacterium gyesilva]
MTRPTHYLFRMLAFLAAVIVVVALLSDALLAAFAANPVLNSLIVLVELLGIAWNIRQVTRLTPEVTWLETFQKARNRLAALPAPKLLAPMASMLASRGGKGREGQERFTISAPAMRSLLDSIASRLDESRELSRYMVGLLIFLGLLGTFWGLLLTVHSVGDVITGMSVGSGDINALFEQLKSGLAQPLKGMGTAFSCSMLGLAGALVLGFLDLTAGQAQNRFFNELEEWLAGLTRLSSGVLGGEGEGGSVPVYVQALLEQTAENMETLQRTLMRGEDDRRGNNEAMLALTERLATLTDTMRTSQHLMLRIAESHQALTPALQRLGEVRDGDDVARAHLRNIEIYMQRLLTENEQGRAQTTAELRNEIKVLTRTIAALAEEQPR